MSDLFQSDIELLNSGLRPFQMWQARALKVLQSWEMQEPAAGYKTGLVALDNYIRLVPGEVTVWAARPGMGKTALCLQIAQSIIPSASKDNKRVAIFSAEMSGWSLYLRIACAIAGTTMFDLRSGRADGLGYDMTKRAIKLIANYPILVDDKDSPSTEYMRKEIALLNERLEISALIFDFLELVGDGGSSKENMISNAMLNLKAIAKEFAIPVLVISHLNREVESRADKIPQLDDLRGSGMIEQLADQVVLMVRPKYYLDNGVKIDLKAYDAFAGVGGAASNVDDICYFIIAKNRNGAKGVARVEYDGPNMRFRDIQRRKLNENLE